MRVADEGSNKRPPAKKAAPVAKVTQPKRKFYNPQLQAMYDNLLAQQAIKVKATSGIDMGPIPEFVDARELVAKTLKKGETLSPELQRLKAQVDRIDAGTKRMEGKSEKKHKQSALNRVIDILSRGMYASAEAVRAADAEDRENRYHGKNKFLSAITSLSEIPHGAWEGFTGKKKTSYADVFQQDADEDYAAKHGLDPKDVAPGTGHVNKWVKYGVGTGLDIALDPTTYVGVGLVGKGLRLTGKAITKGGKEATEAEKAIQAARAQDRLLTGRGTEHDVGILEGLGEAVPPPVSAVPEAVKAEAVKRVKSSVKTKQPKAKAAQADPNAVIGRGDIPGHFDNGRWVVASEVPTGKVDELRLPVSHMAEAAKEVERRAAPVIKQIHSSPQVSKVVLDPAEIKRAEAVAEEQARIKLGRSRVASGNTKWEELPAAEVRKTKEYKDALFVATRESKIKKYTVQIRQSIANEVEKEFRVKHAADVKGRIKPHEMTEEFPVAGLDNVHPQIRIHAEEEAIAKFEAKADRAARGVGRKGESDVADATLTEKSKLFHNQPKEVQDAWMKAEKPKLVNKILKAQKEAGLLDEAPVVGRAAEVAAKVGTVAATHPAMPTNAAEHVAAAAAGHDPVQMLPIDQAPVSVKPKPKKGTKPAQWNGKPADDLTINPLTEAERSIVDEVTEKLSKSIDENVHNARYGANMQKLIGGYNMAVNRLVAMRTADKVGKDIAITAARLHGTEGLKARALAIMREAEAATGHTFVVTPSGVPFRLLDQLEHASAADLKAMGSLGEILAHDASAAAVIGNHQVSTFVENVLTKPEVNAVERHIAQEAVGEATTKVALDEGVSVPVAVQAGKAAEKAAEKVADELDETSKVANDLGEVSAKGREGALDGTATEARIQELSHAYQVASYRYLGIKIGWGENPLLVIPIVKVGKTGQRAAKAAVALSNEEKARRNYNSLIDAVGGSARAFQIAFNNAYGLSPRLHEVEMAAAGGLSNRIKQAADSLGLATRGFNETQKLVAFNHAVAGTVHADENINRLARAYENHMDRMLSNSPGSVINRAGLTTERVLQHIGQIRPRPGVDPIKMPKDLDWRKIEIPQGLDVNHVALAIETGVQKAVVEKMTADQIVSLFGAGGREWFQHQALSLSRESRNLDAVKHPYLPPEFNGVKFPNEVADQIEYLYKKLHDIQTSRSKGSNALVRLYDILLGKWKAGVTIYSPAFHERNLIGDAFTGFLDGVGPRAYSKSAKVLANRAAKAGEEIPEEFRMAGRYDSRLIYDPKFANTGVVDDTLEQTIIRSNQVVSSVARRKGSKPIEITNDEYMAQYLNRGLRQNIASSEMLAEAGPNMQRLTQRLGAKMRSASEAREDWPRMAHFIQATERALKQGMSKDEAFAWAARRSKKYHADYQDLTEFERNVMRRVVPFYTWQRRMMPVILENLFTNPGRMAVPSKLLRGISGMAGFDVAGDNKSFPQPEAIVPDWMQQNMLWPVGHHDGNIVYADPGNPFHDMFRQTFNQLDPVSGNFQPVKTFMQQVTPFARVPIEHATGQQFFGSGKGLPIRDNTAYADQQLPILNILSRITNVSPVGSANTLLPGGESPGLVNNPNKSGMDNVALLNTLLATGAQENTEQRKKSELRRQRQIAEAEKKKATAEYLRRRNQEARPHRNY